MAPLKGLTDTNKHFAVVHSSTFDMTQGSMAAMTISVSSFEPLGATRAVPLPPHSGNVSTMILPLLKTS